MANGVNGFSLSVANLQVTNVVASIGVGAGLAMTSNALMDLRHVSHLNRSTLRALLKLGVGVSLVFVSNLVLKVNSIEGQVMSLSDRVIKEYE